MKLKWVQDCCALLVIYHLYREQECKAGVNAGIKETPVCVDQHS